MSEEQYWRRPKEFDLEQFRVFGSDCKKVIELATKKKIKGIEDVEITDDFVMFNVYETFYIDRVLDMDAWKHPLGSDVLFSRAIITNDPNFKYPESHVVIGEEDNEKNYYLQTVRTNRLPSRIVVMACLICLKERFPDVWLDSDTADNDDMDAVVEAVVLAADALAKEGERPKVINPCNIFECLRGNLEKWLRSKVAVDAKKLNDELELARKKKLGFYTDEFQEKMSKELGYINKGIINQEVNTPRGRLNIDARMMTKVEDDGKGHITEISIGYDTKAQVLAALLTK